MKTKRSHSRRPQGRATVLPETLDQMMAGCDHIATLAGLLAACHSSPLAEGIEPPLVARAGRMIALEVEKLSERMRRLESALATKARRR